MKETQAKKRKRALQILEILKHEFPNAKTPLTHKNIFQLLVAVILSAQCTDKQVNKVTPALFQKFPNAESFAKAKRSEIERMIFSTGFYRNKAESIQGAAQKIIRDFNGNIPSTMEKLLTIPGVGRKTANVILESGFGKIEGIVVDTHVVRISKLLRLISSKAEGNPVKIEQELMKILPKSEWGNVGLLFIYHGRKTCIARRPKCHKCPLLSLCPGRKI